MHHLDIAAQLVVAITEGGAVCGGYNPAGWIGLGDDRDSIAAFLFTWPDGNLSLPPEKLKKAGLHVQANHDPLQIATAMSGLMYCLPWTGFLQHLGLGQHNRMGSLLQILFKREYCACAIDVHEALCCLSWYLCANFLCVVLTSWLTNCPQVGGASLAILDRAAAGPQFGADGLKILLEDGRERCAQSRLGRYLATFCFQKYAADMQNTRCSCLTCKDLFAGRLTHASTIMADGHMWNLFQHDCCCDSVARCAVITRSGLEALGRCLPMVKIGKPQNSLISRYGRGP